MENRIRFYNKSITNLYNCKFDLIVSNPPYIDRKNIKNLDDDIKKYEPKIALIANDNGYSFDGASFSRLSPYNWRDVLNRDIKWGFEGHTLKWSFMKGYQMLFYYKI